MLGDFGECTGPTGAHDIAEALRNPAEMLEARIVGQADDRHCALLSNRLRSASSGRKEAHQLQPSLSVWAEPFPRTGGATDANRDYAAVTGDMPRSVDRVVSSTAHARRCSPWLPEHGSSER